MKSVILYIGWLKEHRKSNSDEEKWQISKKVFKRRKKQLF